MKKFNQKRKLNTILFSVVCYCISNDIDADLILEEFERLGIPTRKIIGGITEGTVKQIMGKKVINFSRDGGKRDDSFTDSRNDSVLQR